MNPRSLSNFFGSKFGLFAVFVVVLFSGLWIYGRHQSSERELAKLAAQSGKKIDLGQVKVPLNQGLESGVPQQVKPSTGGFTEKEAANGRAHRCAELRQTIVALRIGPIFGNAVRDGCGLLDVNSFSGLQEFNALASELNSLVEKNVLPVLREKAVLGAHLNFAGCAEAPETVAGADEPLLIVIPVEAEVPE